MTFLRPARSPNFAGRRASGVLAAISLAAAAFASPSPAAACEVALVLAHDVSHSVSREEYALQTEGHAAAFRDREVQHLVGQVGGVSAMLLHWSGSPHQEVMIGWRRLETSAEMDAFADDLAAAVPSVGGFGTALGTMLAYARSLWTAEVAHCGRKVIDISGDGENNDGPDIEPARTHLLNANVTINGLAIRRDFVPLNRGIEDYYRNRLIGGPGAFAMAAGGFDDYARVFKKKLLRELKTPVVADADADEGAAHRFAR